MAKSKTSWCMEQANLANSNHQPTPKSLMKRHEEKRQLVQQLRSPLENVLTHRLPNMGTPLPPALLNKIQPSPSVLNIAQSIMVGGGAPANSVLGKQLVRDIGAASLVMFLSQIPSIHPVYAVRRSPITKQVFIDDEMYILMLTGALIESTGAGPGTMGSGIIKRGLKRGCRNAEKRMSEPNFQVLGQICALVKHTY